MSDVWMNWAEVSAYLGVSRATLQKWRSDGYGPKFVKHGQLLRYRRSDVDAWLEAGEAEERREQ